MVKEARCAVPPHLVVAKHTAVAKKYTVRGTWHMHITGNNMNPSEDPQPKSPMNAFLAQSRGNLVPFTWRPHSIPNTDIQMLLIYPCSKMPPNRLSLLPRVVRVSYHTAVAGRYLEVAARTKRPRPTHPVTHPSTNPSSRRTPQPPCATAARQYVEQQTVGVFGRRTGTGYRVGAVAAFVCCYLALCSWNAAVVRWGFCVFENI